MQINIIIFNYNNNILYFSKNTLTNLYIIYTYGKHRTKNM